MQPKPHLHKSIPAAAAAAAAAAAMLAYALYP
jgi:hypothetical protein